MPPSAGPARRHLGDEIEQPDVEAPEDRLAMPSFVASGVPTPRESIRRRCAKLEQRDAEEHHASFLSRAELSKPLMTVK